MTLWIDNRQEFLTENLQDFFERILRQTLRSLKLDIQAEVSLLLVDNAQIRQLNREYRGKDVATDVLSFPQIDLSPSGESPDRKTLEENRDPGTGETVLGDIVLSVERAMEQADEYGHSIRTELAFLMAHGLLHLLGYDHEKGKEMEQTMNRLQESILQALDLSRERELKEP